MLEPKSKINWFDLFPEAAEQKINCVDLFAHLGGTKTKPSDPARGPPRTSLQGRVACSAGWATTVCLAGWAPSASATGSACRAGLHWPATSASCQPDQPAPSIHAWEASQVTGRRFWLAGPAPPNCSAARRAPLARSPGSASWASSAAHLTNVCQAVALTQPALMATFVASSCGGAVLFGIAWDVCCGSLMVA